LEEDSSLVKIALEFLYSGWTDADVSPIAMQLLPLASKFNLGHLEDLCKCHVQNSLNANNVVQAILLAHVHQLDDLYHLCVPMIKANAHCLSEKDLDKLQQNPVVFRKVFKDCCMKLF